MSKTCATAIILAVAVFQAGISHAGPRQDAGVMTVYAVKTDGESRIIKVPYEDLNLSSPADVRVLRGRVEVAAGMVCEPKLYAPELSEFGRRECLDRALTGTRPQLALAKRRAVEIARTGHSAIPPVAIAMRAGF